MAAAPMDMLRKCRDQFAAYANEHHTKAVQLFNPPAYRERALRRAEINQQMVDEIDATLKEWG